MSTRKIVVYPEPVLCNKTNEIKELDYNIISLAEEMAEIMYQAPGVGLAAPQVGVDKRLIVVDPTSKRDSGLLITLINPVIVEREGREVDSEMCLSVPEISVDVPRSLRLLIRGITLQGKETEFEIEGFPARIFQHEIDHLDGKVILDYASKLKRSIYLKKVKKGKI